MSRMEQIKARVAATMAKSSTASEQRSPIYQAPAFDDGMSRARGGLGTALHPALMDNAALDARSSKQALLPKHAAALGNRSLAEQKSKVGKGKKQLDISGPSAEETRNK